MQSKHLSHGAGECPCDADADAAHDISISSTTYVDILAAFLHMPPQSRKLKAKSAHTPWVQFSVSCQCMLARRTRV